MSDELSEEIFIHVGLQKTATTTLQEYLFARHPQIYYLGRPYKNNMIEDLIKAVYMHESIDYDENYWSEVVYKSIYPLRRKGLVLGISEEFFTGSVGIDRGLIAQRLKRLFGSARILFTIREQVSALESEYIDTINYRSYSSYEEWISIALSSPQNSSLRLYDYDRLTSYYEAIFGRENVGVFLFEEFLKDRRAFLDRLCKFIGINVDVAESVLGKAHANPRKSQRLLIYKKIRSRLLSDTISISQFVPNRLNDRFQHYISMGKRGKVKYDESYKVEIRKFYQKGNARLTERYALPLNSFGYSS